MEPDELEELAKRVDEEWADDPNVVGVGYGVKVADDEYTEGQALRFVVREKFQTESEIRAAGSEPIPESIEGVPTDVVVNDATTSIGSFPVGDRGTTIEEPLRGGVSTSPLGDFLPFPTGYGTLGGLCYQDGDLMALSNAHVWGDEMGADIIQPFLPIGEYVEATVKLWACGPLIAYLSEGETPSGLTTVLAGAAAAAWTAAAASDWKDPHRRGQEATSPGADERTVEERVTLEAEPDDLALPGVPYEADVSWEYVRETDRDTYAHGVDETRTNEHVLVRKHVWTDAGEYEPGETAEIRGLVETTRASSPEEYHVVAHLVPENDPARRVTRVLRPTECERSPYRCVSFGREKVDNRMESPYEVGPLTIHTDGKAYFRQGTPPVTETGGPAVLQFPHEGLEIDIPPSARAQVRVFGFGGTPIRLRGFDADGDRVDEDTTSQAADREHRLTVEGDPLERLTVSGGSNEAMLIEVCLQRAGEVPPVESAREESEVFCYRGEYTVDTDEEPGPWRALLSVQTVDTVGPAADPVEAARTIGGIEESRLAGTTLKPAACAITLLLDDVFDVI